MNTEMRERGKFQQLRFWVQNVLPMYLKKTMLFSGFCYA